MFFIPNDIFSAKLEHMWKEALGYVFSSLNISVKEGMHPKGGVFVASIEKYHNVFQYSRYSIYYLFIVLKLLPSSDTFITLEHNE